MAGSDLEPFLNLGATFAIFQISGRVEVSRDFWKSFVAIGASSWWTFLRTTGLIWSGPAALCGFRSLSSFSTPAIDMSMLGMVA